MLDINPKYLVNTKGRKTAVVLSMKEYRLLMKHLEDLEDILEMDAAVETETASRDYREIRAELKKKENFECPDALYCLFKTSC